MNLPCKLNNNNIIPLYRKRLERFFWRSAKNNDVILLNAPTGYSKTTTALQCLGELNYTYAYICFDNFLDDMDKFVECLNAELLRACPEIETVEDDRCLNNLERLFRKICDIKKLDVLFLDNFHYCKNKEIYSLIKSIYSHRGGSTQLILTSQSNIPSELAELQFHGKVKEITADELRFTQNELFKFCELNKVHLSKKSIDTLIKRADGCIGAIRYNLIGTNPIYYENILRGRFDSKTVHKMAMLSGLDKISFQLFDENGFKNKLLDVRHDTGLVTLHETCFSLHKTLQQFLQIYKNDNNNENVALIQQLLSKGYTTEAFQIACNYSLDDEAENILSQIGENFPKLMAISNDLLIYLENKTVPPVHFLLQKSLHIFEVLKGNSSLEHRYREDGFCKNLINITILRHPLIYQNYLTALQINSSWDFKDTDKHLISAGIAMDKLSINEAFEELAKVSENSLQYKLLLSILLFISGESIESEKILSHLKYDYMDAQDREKADFIISLIQILQGKIDAAKEYAECCSIGEYTTYSNYEKLCLLAYAHILLNKMETAKFILHQLLLFSAKTSFFRLMAHCKVLMSILYMKLNKTEKAIDYMSQSIHDSKIASCSMVIGMYGHEVLFLLEKCFSKAKKTGSQHEYEFALLMHVKKHITGSEQKEQENLSGTATIKFSQRQKTILELLYKTFTYQQIADSCGIKITTVRDHIHKIYQKLGVNGRVDAISKALELRII